jgi:hypothetical protein
MITYQHLKSKPALFQSFTGLTLPAFAQLLPAFAQAYARSLDTRDQQRPLPRQRQRGGGRKAVLQTAEDKMVFILVYFRHYPVQVLQGFLFGMGQSQANEWIHRLTPLLEAALGQRCYLPARPTKDLTTLLAACPGLEFILDGTERPVRRAKDPHRQQAQYSGKKKRHTVKNVVISDKRTRKIKGLSATVAGKTHDKKLADEAGVDFPLGSRLWKDSGFQGYEPEGVSTFQPKKKPKGGELTAEEKAENQRIARERIGVEHSIGGVKVYGIVREVFRNLKGGFEDVVMVIACGLHNLRLEHPLTA